MINLDTPIVLHLVSGRSLKVGLFCFLFFKLILSYFEYFVGTAEVPDSLSTCLSQTWHKLIFLFVEFYIY